MTPDERQRLRKVAERAIVEFEEEQAITQGLDAGSFSSFADKNVEVDATALLSLLDLIDTLTKERDEARKHLNSEYHARKAAEALAEQRAVRICSFQLWVRDVLIGLEGQRIAARSPAGEEAHLWEPAKHLFDRAEALLTPPAGDRAGNQ